MTSENAVHAPTSTYHAIRYHLPLVVVFVLLGGLAGWLYLAASPPTYASTASVLVNPATGNPYSPTPSSVRADEATSLETEAQLASSVEVLSQVADSTSIPLAQLQRGVQVVVPPNTQVLQITYNGPSAEVAQAVTDVVATTYLDARESRFQDVKTARVERIESRTLIVVDDLRKATAGAQQGTAADRLFQKQLADALRNELVSLRAQRTALENADSPVGSVVSPASTPTSSSGLTMLAFPLGGLFAGLVLGALLAVLIERARGVVHTPAQVEVVGLPVLASARPAEWSSRSRTRSASRVKHLGDAVRRSRTAMLDRDHRPEIIAISPAGDGRSAAGVSQRVAESFAKAGHRVVLVQTDDQPGGAGTDGPRERGLAQALLHERLSVVDLLQPTDEPLLCRLPDGGFDEHSSELLSADRVWSVLAPLVDAGYLVIIQAPGIGTPEGEAIVGAADLCVVVVTRGRTRVHAVRYVTEQARTGSAEICALVVDHLRPGAETTSPAAVDESDEEPTSAAPGSDDGAPESTSADRTDEDDEAADHDRSGTRADAKGSLSRGRR